MRLSVLAETSRRVAATRSRLEKVALLADVIGRLPPSLVAVGVGYLAGDLPQGKLGVGYSLLGSLRGTPAAGEPKPAQLNWVRSRCRSSRLASGTETSTTSHWPSHACSLRPKP